MWITTDIFSYFQMRVVASLTTIPGRYPKLLRTLRSLQAQDHPFDAIYLTIPREARRLKKAYPELPPEITSLVTVVSCEDDYGPLTKIVGGLLRESEAETIIITVDDDVVYSPTLVSSLLVYAQKYPQEAIGSSGMILRYSFPFFGTISNCPGHWNNITGFKLPEEGRQVDALCGFSAILYRRGFFANVEELVKYPLMDEDVYYNDDIMISAYLSGQGVPRRVVPHIPLTNETKVFDPALDKLDGNEISFDKIAFLRRFIRSIDKVKSWGFFAESTPVTFDETIGGRIVMAIILIILIIVAGYYYLRSIRQQ